MTTPLEYKDLYQNAVKSARGTGANTSNPLVIHLVLVMNEGGFDPLVIGGR